MKGYRRSDGLINDDGWQDPGPFGSGHVALERKLFAIQCEADLDRDFLPWKVGNCWQIALLVARIVIIFGGLECFKLCEHRRIHTDLEDFLRVPIVFWNTRHHV